MAAVNYWSDYWRLINFGEKTLIIKGWKMYLSDLDLPSFVFRQNAERFLQCFLSLLHVEHLVFFQWIYIFGSGFCKTFFSVIIHQSQHKNVINPSVLILKPLCLNPACAFMWCWIWPHLCRCVISWPITATAARWSPVWSNSSEKGSWRLHFACNL